MTHHSLKTWPAMFEAVWRGDKTFEVRLDDRGYQKGDTVQLREWERQGTCSCLDEKPAAGRSFDHGDDCERYSGREISARVGHVLASTAPRGNQRGFNGNGYVVFSLCEMAKVDGRAAKVDAAAIARKIAAAPIALTLPRDAAL